MTTLSSLVRVLLRRRDELVLSAFETPCSTLDEYKLLLGRYRQLVEDLALARTLEKGLENDNDESY